MYISTRRDVEETNLAFNKQIVTIIIEFNLTFNLDEEEEEEDKKLNVLLNGLSFFFFFNTHIASIVS